MLGFLHVYKVVFVFGRSSLFVSCFLIFYILFLDINSVEEYCSDRNYRQWSECTAPAGRELSRFSGRCAFRNRLPQWRQELYLVISLSYYSCKTETGYQIGPYDKGPGKRALEHARNDLIR